MLDIRLELLDSTGASIAVNNPSDSLNATINLNVTAGTYYLKVEGVGFGAPPTSGYTDYSSLGQYRLTGSYSVSSGGTSNNVQAVYNTKTRILTITGDTGSNSVTVTRNTNGSVTVAGSAGTTVNNLDSQTFTAPSKIGLTARMGDGDDSLVVTGLFVSTLDTNLGGGADSFRVTLSNIGWLILDGGPGTDGYTRLTTPIKRTTLRNMP
jgi:serralysin